jgi:O-antigen biosynthesis protein
VQLSIIIVNYNVKYFLEHCIISVMASTKNIVAEIIVVDNVSTDGSVAMLRSKYTSVITIANDENVGFAKANNQGVAIAKGEYILFLNPDTIVPEDCFSLCLAYLKLHPHVGALGPRLVDGKGVFLPESKRGFPSFDTAFYKIIGLSTFFAKSKFFNKYHLGFLPQHQTNEVDVLAGCFMMMPRTVVQTVGGFSEDYFMYGEDIDLSYTIQKAGYENIYFADTTVIHYKGESTKKGSLNYVKMFYNAMIIFARKHLAQKQQKLFIPLIQFAITARAVLSIANGFLQAILLPMLDALIMFICLWQTKNYWVSFVKPQTKYATNTLLVFFSVYTLIWICTLFLNGVYDKPLKKISILRGMLIGAIITLALYGMLPEHIRFSRGITLLGAATSATLIWIVRSLLQSFGFATLAPADTKGQNILTVGSVQQVQEVHQLLKSAGIEKDIIGNVNAMASNQSNQDLGQVAYLPTIASSYQAAEIIFTYDSISFGEIISYISKLGPSYNYKIHAAGTDSIIGSNSKNTAGDLYAADWHFQIAKASGKRNKRVFDILAAAIIILFYPITFWIWKPTNIFQNAIRVLFAKNTWVGYCQSNEMNRLPKIKNGIITIYFSTNSDNINLQYLNLQYARNYNIAQDVKMLWRYLYKAKSTL